MTKVAFSGKHTDGLVSVQRTSLNMRSLKLFSVSPDQKTETKKPPSLMPSSKHTNAGDLPLPLKFYKKKKTKTTLARLPAPRTMVI